MGPRLGMVARLDRIKDHKTIIRATALVAKIRPDIVVEFAGDGPLMRELQHEARCCGVADQVRFLGSMPVGYLLASWDIYTHSTTDSEGMGTAVAEAMMSGLPCLVSDLAVMREVCGLDGAAYAPAGNAEGFAAAIVALINDRTRREMMGRNARVIAREIFGLPKIAAAYERVVFPREGRAGP